MARRNGERLWVWVTRAAGLVGIAWVLLFDDADRPYLLILFGGMIGVGTISKLAQRGDAK